ncbi:hypothetical protein CLOM_g7918 [Closterium sp. NIES-68]|nr:hypothetical protein CLOM_g7918 [Closterium sp. NIES-68]GJP60291.1 hypothetical protein CLOP_g17500 [Closterium sp. NIES-67]
MFNSQRDARPQQAAPAASVNPFLSNPSPSSSSPSPATPFRTPPPAFASPTFSSPTCAPAAFASPTSASPGFVPPAFASPTTAPLATSPGDPSSDPSYATPQATIRAASRFGPPLHSLSSTPSRPRSSPRSPSQSGNPISSQPVVPPSPAAQSSTPPAFAAPSASPAPWSASSASSASSPSPKGRSWHGFSPSPVAARSTANSKSPVNVVDAATTPDKAASVSAPSSSRRAEAEEEVQERCGNGGASSHAGAGQRVGAAGKAQEGTKSEPAGLRTGSAGVNGVTAAGSGGSGPSAAASGSAELGSARVAGGATPQKAGKIRMDGLDLQNGGGLSGDRSQPSDSQSACEPSQREENERVTAGRDSSLAAPPASPSSSPTPPPSAAPASVLSTSPSAAPSHLPSAVAASPFPAIPSPSITPTSPSMTHSHHSHVKRSASDNNCRVQSPPSSAKPALLPSSRTFSAGSELGKGAAAAAAAAVAQFSARRQHMGVGGGGGGGGGGSEAGAAGGKGGAGGNIGMAAAAGAAVVPGGREGAEGVGSSSAVGDSRGDSESKPAQRNGHSPSFSSWASPAPSSPWVPSPSPSPSLRTPHTPWNAASPAAPSPSPARQFPPTPSPWSPFPPASSKARGKWGAVARGVWWGTAVLGALQQRSAGGLRRLALLIALNSAYSTAELIVGLLIGRIELVSDSFHLSFGCCILLLSLAAMLLGKRPADATFTYGYERLEVLAAFTNGLFLLFLSFSLAVECLHAYIEDEAEHKHYLVMSAVVHLLINLLGVFFFKSFARRTITYQRPRDMNHHAILLHLLCDSIRSGGVVLASWFIAMGVYSAEAICLGLVSLAVLVLALPLVHSSGNLLLQMAPAGISEPALHKCIRHVAAYEGVEECFEHRFWAVVPGHVVGTLTVRVRQGVDEQKVLEHVHSIFNDIGVRDLTVQIESTS